MLKTKKMPGCSRNWVAAALLFLTVFLIYSNTFHAAWQMDDFHNIVDNPRLHIENLYPDSLIQTFYAAFNSGTYDGTVLYRPVSCLTLALNWYFGKSNVFGYHIVNTAIHFVAGFILFLTILNLFRSPNLKDKYLGQEYGIALLAAVLWAMHPIQIQAVTYIVQRMASLAAMFYIASIYFYIKGRIDGSRLSSPFFFFACLISFFLALGSKENAATLPIALFLIEIAFFQNLHLPHTRKIVLRTAIGIGAGILILGYLLVYFVLDDPFFFLKNYEVRPFTLFERLGTEPRVLIFYLTQIFYPVSTRFSIAHDVVTSTSLFNPWTTLPAILTVLFLIGIGIYFFKSKPIVAFSILFFFLSHLIESTIIPLEIIFEHRNYLPSLFLFFPVSVGIYRIMTYYRETKRPMFWIVACFTMFILFGIGVGTYTRNSDWKTNKTLWESAMKTAPGRSRPYQYIGNVYSVNRDFDAADELFEKSLSLQDSKPRHSRCLALSNLALNCQKRKEYEKAVKLLKQVVNTCPELLDHSYQLVMVYVSLEKWDEAIKGADYLLSVRSDYPKYLDLKGFILLKHKKPEEALPFFLKSYAKEPKSAKTIFHIGAALSLMGKYRQAEKFLKTANRQSPDLIPLCWLVENSLKAGDAKGANAYIGEMLAKYNIEKIKAFLKDFSKPANSVSVSSELISRQIAEKLIEISKEMNLSRYP